jgi:hypothetical protein
MIIVSQYFGVKSTASNKNTQALTLNICSSGYKQYKDIQQTITAIHTILPPMKLEKVAVHQHHFGYHYKQHINGLFEEIVGGMKMTSSDDMIYVQQWIDGFCGRHVLILKSNRDKMKIQITSNYYT